MPRPTDESFLVRWSRRKRANQLDPTVGTRHESTEPDNTSPPSAETGHQEPVAKQVEGERQQAADPPTASDEIPDDLKEVDVDALDYESDFARFLEKDVPEALRRRALRQLWRSDPVLANVDGLNDYDDDFTDAALAVKVLETAHKVGRGYLKDAAEEEGDGDDNTAKVVLTVDDKPDESTGDLVAQDDTAEMEIEPPDTQSGPQAEDTKTT
jgi:Protein of unknown function (DUF3306)